MLRLMRECLTTMAVIQVLKHVSTDFWRVLMFPAFFAIFTNDAFKIFLVKKENISSCSILMHKFSVI